MSTLSIREKHIDRLLSEEFECSGEFARWFAEEVFGKNNIPQGTPRSMTEIGHFRITGVNRRSGETDVRVEMRWPNEEQRIILVEDKINADPQPDQAERYQEACADEYARLREQGIQGKVATALVCPERWSNSQKKESGVYDAIVSFEKIAQFLDARREKLERESGKESIEIAKRLSWKSTLLTDSLKRRIQSGEHSSDLTIWNEEASALIHEACGFRLKINPRQKSDNPHESRFLEFDHTLSSWGKTEEEFKTKKTKIYLKTSNRKNRNARVSLTLSNTKAFSSLRHIFEKMAEEAGYKFEDTGASFLIDASSEKMKDLYAHAPVGEQIDALYEAGDLAAEMIRWWEEQ